MSSISYQDILFTVFTFSGILAFYVGVFITRKQIFNAIKGDNGRMDTKELPIYLWWWLFPFLMFYTLLLVASSIEVSPIHKELIMSAWAAIGVFTTFIIGQQTIKPFGNKSKDESQG